MTGNELFALIFISIVVFGTYICTFLELGGLDSVADWLVKFIESRIVKGEDI